ncbi:hypothetical protein D1007_20553 [Hordeum vulgare]|nr:hypothetical protein D1007_20553 [Hordeum vulgare]
MASQSGNKLWSTSRSDKKRNDGSISYQSIGLNDDDDGVVVSNGKATMPKDNRLFMGTKWEKARIARDAKATKMSSTWTGIFSARESKKEEMYKLMLDVQRKRMEWDRTRAERRLEIDREKIELEKKDATIKWELEKAKTFEEIELEKERLQLSCDAEDAKIMLADESTLDEHAKKWLVDKKKEINHCRALEAARAATAATAEQVVRMHALKATRMQAEEATRMQADMVAHAKQDA